MEKQFDMFLEGMNWADVFYHAEMKLLKANE